MADDPSPPLAKPLLSYCLEHPTTADTSEGFARWRLLEQYVEHTMRETEVALEWLVRHGFLREIPRPAGPPVFVMNPERRREAADFVADRPDPEDDRGDR